MCSPASTLARLARLAALVAAAALPACGDEPEGLGPATTPQTLVATPATIWVQPGEVGTFAFDLAGPAAAPLPGVTIALSIVDDPQTPGTEAQGATLVAASAVTDSRGQATARVTAGSPTVFRVRASSPNAMTEAVIVVAAGGVGAVDVAPFFRPPSSAAALARTIEVFFFDNSACRDIAPRKPPQPARRMRSIATTAGAVTRYEFVSTAVGHAILARAIDARGSLLALGCADLPGPTLVAGGAVQIALPLADVGPDPLGRFSVTTTLVVAPPLAAAEGIAAIWRDLTDCPLDPAQRWLDCTIDALGPTTDADPLDCVPATTPGGDGAMGDAVSALRGTFSPGPDGKPTACRGSKTVLGAVSADAAITGLFGSPRPAAFVRLEAAAEDAAHLFDDLRLRSTLELGKGSTLGAVTATHTLDAVGFSLPGASTDVALMPLGLPALSASPEATIRGGTLALGTHAFTLRLGTAGRVAFGTVSLARRRLPGNSQDLVAALAALAVDEDTGAAGCVALDAKICPRLALASGCVAAACATGLEALATRLDASFDLADGTSFDLYLAGEAPLLDTHGNGLADRLGDPATPAGAGTWTVDLRPRGGRRSLPATWDAIRAGN